MKIFVSGQKLKLQDLTSSSVIEVKVNIVHKPGAIIDISCFGLDLEGVLSDDRYMIFYNQKLSPCRSLCLKNNGNGYGEFSIDLEKIPLKILKLVFTATIDGDYSMSQMCEGYFSLYKDKSEIARYNFSGNDFRNEKAIKIAEIYNKGVWKFGAIGQGFNGGLSALLKSFGGEEIKEKSLISTPYPSSSTSKPKINLAKGKINLSKSNPIVLIKKTKLLTATCSWKTGTDYDVYALVLVKKKNSYFPKERVETIHVSTFGAVGIPAQPKYKTYIKHLGDVQRDGAANSIKTETIEIRLSDEILAIVPVVYSAQSNGTGSFKRYKVSSSIDNGQGDIVTISADDANDNNRIYSLVPGCIYNEPSGVRIERLEMYSSPNSEKRPKLYYLSDGSVKILMDKGPKNHYK